MRLYERPQYLPGEVVAAVASGKVVADDGNRLLIEVVNNGAPEIFVCEWDPSEGVFVTGQMPQLAHMVAQ